MVAVVFFTMFLRLCCESSFQTPLAVDFDPQQYLTHCAQAVTHDHQARVVLAARLRETLVLVDGLWFRQTAAAKDSIVLGVHEHCGKQWRQTLVGAHEVAERLSLRINLQHVAVAAGTTPILRFISKHRFKRGLPTHRLTCLGQELMLHLLDARFGHFSDPCLDFVLVLLCSLSFAPVFCGWRRES